MAWTKGKRVSVGVTVILAAVTIVVLTRFARRPGEHRTQLLEDGSTLTLSRVEFGSTAEFLHGKGLEKLLGNAIPRKGLHIAQLNLNRPTGITFQAPDGKTSLGAEFRLAGANAVNYPLYKPGFSGEFRCVIRDESGAEFVQPLRPDGFTKYPDGYFGYIFANCYPRDSRWLWLEIERRTNQDKDGPWPSVAQFKLRNPAKPKIQKWSALAPPITNSVGGVDFVLNQMTEVTQTYSPRSIWNHAVTAPFEVRSNGVVLTNWDAPYVRVEDASGNWDYGPPRPRALDYRYVWKLEADFEAVSNLPAENVVSIKLPKPSSPITTNFMNLPVAVSWDGYWVNASIPTNRSDLALRFIRVADAQGEQTSEASGSWNQYSFHKGSFMWRKGGVLHVGDFRPTTLTLAIVPNVHATFYARPRLIVDQKKN